MTDCTMDLPDSGARIADDGRAASTTMSLLILNKPQGSGFEAVSACVLNVRQVL